MSAADVDLACTLNKDHELDQELDRLQLSSAQYGEVDHAAVLACLGSAEAPRAGAAGVDQPQRCRTVQIAQVYLRHRPIDGCERASRRRQSRSRA